MADLVPLLTGAPSSSACTIRRCRAEYLGWQAVSTRRSPGPSAEHGRGIAIMEALMDSLHFEVKPESGTVVHLEKALEFTAGSLLRRTRGH